MMISCLAPVKVVIFLGGIAIAAPSVLAGESAGINDYVWHPFIGNILTSIASTLGTLFIAWCGYVIHKKNTAYLKKLDYANELESQFSFYNNAVTIYGNIDFLRNDDPDEAYPLCPKCLAMKKIVRMGDSVEQEGENRGAPLRPNNDEMAELFCPVCCFRFFDRRRTMNSMRSEFKRRLNQTKSNS